MSRSIQFGHKNKYGAKSADGFASKLERAVHVKLKDREVLGLITDIKRQQTVLLEDLKTGEKIRWKVDFSFTDIPTGATVYCEAKGHEDNVYLRKRNMWRRNPPFKLEIWKGVHNYPKLVEVIELKEGE